MKKYVLTEETKTYCGRTLHRIVAVSDFGAVQRGEIGGWIEKESNLSKDGDAWVGDEAMVFGDALVWGDAWVDGCAKVFGNARVCGDAWVEGYAMVFGKSLIYGDAWIGDHAIVYDRAMVYGDSEIGGVAGVCNSFIVLGGKWEVPPLYIQGSLYPFNVASDRHVRIGCEIQTWETWRNEYRKIAKKHTAEDIISEYAQYFNLACKLYGHEDCLIKEE